MITNNKLISEIKSIFLISKENAVPSVDNERTLMYLQIGKRIFEEEQQGKDRAEYGEYLTKYFFRTIRT